MCNEMTLSLAVECFMRLLRRLLNDSYGSNDCITCVGVLDIFVKITNNNNIQKHWNVYLNYSEINKS